MKLVLPLLLLFGAWAPSFASTIDVDASVGGSSISCCGNGLFSIPGYETPLYSFQGGTIDFGTIVLSPYTESVGPSTFQVFMGSVTSSFGPVELLSPTILYGDSCVDGYGYNCSNLSYPSPITTSLVFTLPDNQTTQLQLVFLGSFDYMPPTTTPLPSTWPLMLSVLLGVGFMVQRTSAKHKAARVLITAAEAGRPSLPSHR